MLDRAVEHDGLAGKQSQMAQHVTQPAKMPIDSVPREVVLSWDQWGVRHGYLPEQFILSWFGTTWSMIGTVVTFAALALALLAPEPMEIFNYREGEPHSDWRRSWRRLEWRPTRAWVAATALVFIAAFDQIGRVSEFLYYQF